MKRLIRWLVVLIVLGAVIGVASGPGLAYWKERNKVNFRQAEVTQGKIVAVVNSTGTVKPVLSVSVGSFVSGPIVEVHPRPAEPLVVRPEQLTGEDGARPQRIADVGPQIRKTGGLAERQGEARVHEVARRQLPQGLESGVAHLYQGREFFAHLGADALLDARIRVDGDNMPAEFGEPMRLDAVPAAEVERVAGLGAQPGIQTARERGAHPAPTLCRIEP